MRFEEAYGGWQQGRLTQEEAARLLGVCERTFRRYIDRYEDEGLDGLIDKRLNQISHRRAPVDEVVRLVDCYRKRHEGWNAKHFYAWYKRDGGERSYSWVKNRLQDAQLVSKADKRGAHRKKRERSPLPGMMLHQDASTHEWVPGQHWDLIVTMDDATNEHYSIFFVEAFAVCGILSKLMACLAPSTAIAAAITGLPRKRAARLIKSISPNSGGR